MFKKIIMMMGLYASSITILESNFKVAISIKDFHDGNSILLIARDMYGLEQVAGCVPLHSGKTKFSFDEISHDYQKLSSIPEEKVVDIAHEPVDFARKDEDVVYLYFEVDVEVNIVRAIVITNNLLADKPFDVIEFSTSSTLSGEEDDLFENSYYDDLSQLNLTDIQANAPAELSFYNKAVLALYAIWVVKSAQMSQTYKNFTQWFMSHYA